MATPQQWRIDELEALEERLDNEIAGLDEQLGAVYSQIEELASSIDDYLAENDFMQVEQAVSELVGLFGGGCRRRSRVPNQVCRDQEWRG
ncbi:hypothetical protein ACFWY5_50885 [Nonomuraea sp. NPDC059007]|uniref:hypothetical protein n=1 Tax=Nonomuraea sp. NPDC059007 TaxID=3346692 RepID=UPI00368D5E65